MPRVPVVNTRTQSSTNVPGMQAAPANRATSRAVSGLSKTVSNLAFQVAEKQQRTKDTAGKLEAGNVMNREMATFESENKGKIDIGGAVGDVPYSESVRAKAEEVRTATLDKYRGVMSSSAFAQMELTSQESVKNSVNKAERVQRKISADVAKVTGRNIVKDSSELLKSTGDATTAYKNIAETLQFNIDNKEVYGTDDAVARQNKADASELSYSLSQGQIGNGHDLSAIKTAGLENDEEVLSSLTEEKRALLKALPMRNLGDFMTSDQKRRVKNQALSMIRSEARIVKAEVKEGETAISSRVEKGLISFGEAKEMYGELASKINKLPVNESAKAFKDMTATLAMAKFDDSIKDIPTSEWGKAVEDASSMISDDVTKKDFEDRAASIIKNREVKMKENLADYQKDIDPRYARMSAMSLDKTNPAGFADATEMLIAKGGEYKLGLSSIKIASSDFKRIYAPALESGSAPMQLAAINDIKAHTGKYAMKVLSEIVKNPGIAVATNIKNPKLVEGFLNAFNDKDFGKNWDSWASSNGVDKAEEKANIKLATQTGQFGNEFFDVISQMGDGGKTLRAHQEAAALTYKSLRMNNMSASDASDAVTEMFTGEDGAYDVAKTGGFFSARSKVLLPKDNSAGLTKEDMQIAMDKLKDNVMHFKYQLNLDESKGMTNGSFDNEVIFKNSSDGMGVTLNTPEGTAIRDADNKVIMLTWGGLLEVKNTYVPERSLEEDFAEMEGLEDF